MEEEFEMVEARTKENDDFYTQDWLDSSMENDSISNGEEGFMLGYLEG